MSLTDLPVIWPGQPGLSMILWLLLAIIVLYVSRTPAHRGIHAFARVIHNAMRLASHSVKRAEALLRHRNREVLIAAGREAAERQIEREFQRMETVINRDLAAFPSLHRKLNEHIAQMESDYSRTSEVPSAPEAWVKAIEAVAQIPSSGDAMVAEVLSNIQDSMGKAQQNAMEEYREATHERHHLLKHMMPQWRKVNTSLLELNRHVTDLEERSKDIDVQLNKYEEIVKRTDTAERMLSSSSFTQFFISGLVMLIAIGGAIINFNLIAYPMQEMVGGNSYIGTFKTADIAALVIILVELAIGLFLMESLRITHLFPIIGAMDDRLRIRMIWITLTILVILASVESSLAYMRELMAADRQALTQSLSDIPTIMASNTHRWIPTVGQMIMGFILPFALVFVAIPLESFVHSSRTVLGGLGVMFLDGLAFVLRLIGNMVRHLAGGLIQVYDLIIFVPLWFEGLVKGSRAEKPAATGPEEKKEKEEPKMLEGKTKPSALGNLAATEETS